MTDIIEEARESHALRPIDNTPASLLALAVQRGDSMEQLGQLMALQERWEANEARKAYNGAFAAFKAEAVTLVRNKKVTAGPLQGKSYAELFAVVNAVTPALSRYGLSASWKLTKDEKDWIEVTCTLKHERGHSEVVSMGGPPDVGGAKNAIQARASTVSYLERYTLKAIVGLSEQDDDDDGGHRDRDDALDQKGNLGLSPARYKVIRQVAGAALQLFNENDEIGAYGEACAITDNEEKLALWAILKPHSALRSSLKRLADEERAAQAELDAERKVA